MPSASPIYNPQDALKKEARGEGDFDLGEVKEVSDEYVITEKGLLDKDRFYIPKSSIIHIDGQFVWFGITKKDAKQYKRNWAYHTKNKINKINNNNNYIYFKNEVNVTVTISCVLLLHYLFDYFLDRIWVVVVVIVDEVVAEGVKEIQD